MQSSRSRCLRCLRLPREQRKRRSPLVLRLGRMGYAASQFYCSACTSDGWTRLESLLHNQRVDVALSQPPGCNRPTQSLSAVSPTIGLAYAGRTGGVSFGVGYTWVDNPNPARQEQRAAEATVSRELRRLSQWSRLAFVPPQFLSNYNFGSQYLWTLSADQFRSGTSTTHPARV